MHHYDAIVIGAGGWGSAALYHLARRGLKVCALEQFGAGHTRGSSHGESRIIRMAYFMHPDYVPALRRAYELWRHLEAETAQELLQLTGLLCVGEPEGPFIQGLEQCYRTHRIEHERLTAREAMYRYPQFTLPETAACYWDPHGGFLRADAAQRAHRLAAQRHGGETFDEEPVLTVEREGSGLRVRTVRRTLHTAQVVLATGAFTNRFLGGTPIRPVRKVLFWYNTPQPEQFASSRFPCWIAKLGGKNYYGFPTLDGKTIKAAEDSGGQPLYDADAGPRHLLPEDEAHLQPFLAQFLRAQLGAHAHFKTCLYEETVDRHFIVDHHPTLERCIVAAGGSGHGFKFCSYIGETVADLVEHGRAPHRPAIFEHRGRLSAEAASPSTSAFPAANFNPAAVTAVSGHPLSPA